MKEVKSLKINKEWSLFLDRDGVINRKIENDYVKKIEEFEFLDGVLDAIKILSRKFGRIFIVTNQQGIGKGLMTEKELDIIHNYLLENIKKAGGRIDKIYYCPSLAIDNSNCRKPNIGMGEKAKSDYPEIDFNKSVMVGDSFSDMKFGKGLDMFTVFLSSKTKIIEQDIIEFIDLRYENLLSFTKTIE